MVTSYTTGIIYNISLRHALPNRARADGSDGSTDYSTGPSVFGIITKTPVAPGAELMGLSNFSSSNRIRSIQSYGLGNPAQFYMMGWSKTTDVGDYQYLVSIRYNGENPVAGLSIGSTAASGNEGRPYFYDSENGSLWADEYSPEKGNRVDDGAWHHICGVINNNQKLIYVDGELAGRVTISNNLNMSTGDTIDIGDYSASTGGSGPTWDAGTAYNHRGSIALIRVGRGVVSAEQIRTIYNEEKKMFQPNAKCTLVDSRYVNQVEADDSTGLLYAATQNGGGINTFSGLTRIDYDERMAYKLSANGGFLVGGNS